MTFKRFLGGEGPLRKLLEERMRKGPALKKLREQFFRAACRVYDAERFFIALLDDIKVAKASVIIISPFLTKIKVEKFVSEKEVKDALNRGVRLVVVTRPAEYGEVDNVRVHKACIEALENAKIKVFTVNKEQRLHFKTAIIDDCIIYLGSVNPLSVITIEHTPADYMIRFESEALVDEIVENAIGKDIYEKWLQA